MVPHALVELAEIALASGDKDKAISLYKKAHNEFSDYDFDKALLRRILKAADDLKFEF